MKGYRLALLTPVQRFAASAIAAFYVSSAQAEVVTCELDRVTGKALMQDSEKNTIGALGGAFRIDTGKRLVQIRFDDGVTDWMVPDKITRNSRFTAYIFIFDVQVIDSNALESKGESRKVQQSYRLAADGKSAEARRDILKSDYYPLGARYACN